jgi:hypothetical protein
MTVQAAIATPVDDSCAGQIVAFYLFDIAETIDLAQVSGLVGAPGVAARLTPKPTTPAYVQYDKPPLSFDGEALGLQGIAGFRSRVRFYDYGVVSIALSQPFLGPWKDFSSLGAHFIESPELERHAEDLCRKVAERARLALLGARQEYLSEDYLVFAIHQLDRPLTAEELIVQRGVDLAAMLRGEAQPMSQQEIATVLSHRISYLANDVVVPTWNAAFVYDTPAGAQAALEILEFANSQLLELRYYDQRLDRELGAIYARLDRPRRYDQWLGSRYTRTARQVHSLFIEVNQLTDRTENAVKFIGDIYAVRLFRLTAERLGLATWKADVEAKLATLNDISHFAAEQTAMARGQFLELTIVLILILELVLFFVGVMP